MAVPKKRHSSSRRDMRRAHIKMVNPAMSTCPNCGEVTRPHRACTSCGYYKGEQVIAGKETL